MISLTELVLLALAAYRVTRLIVIDAIFEEVRGWFFKKLDFKKQKDGTFLNRENLLMQKLSYLLQCTWCTGVWVTVVMYWVWKGEFDLLPVLAIAGAQGMLHALEPSED